MNAPWLQVEKDGRYADLIVVARSSRYNSAVIDYSFLSRYDNLAFIGVEPEYTEMKKMIPGIKYLPVDNFLHLAKLIASCSLFIGNQSFPFSLAEGLKCKRLLEVYFESTNVLPTGPNGYDFYFQGHFEYLVNAVLNNTV